jgi:hypothetical protein
MPGAYGFELLGAAGAAAHLVEGDPTWPQLSVERRTGAAKPGRSVIGSDTAEIELVAGDRLAMRRAPLGATFTTAQPLSDAALVHPYLAPAAAVAGYWLGRETFHAGAFLLDGGAWGVLGEKASGKSSLLAELARQGHGIVADDALVVDRNVVFAGPRSIDLRQEPAHELAAGESIGLIGDRERWRLRLDLVASTSCLRGWIVLSWGDAMELRPLLPGGRLQTLLEHRMIKGLPPPEPGLLLELAALPAFRLSRPRSWDQLDAAASWLVGRLSAR